MNENREQLRVEFPEASQLLGCFGPDYDVEYNQNERAAADDFIDGHRKFLPATIAELDELLSRYPADAELRGTLLALGVTWTIWDQGNDWRPFVLRLRQWLSESLTERSGQEPGTPD